MRSVFSLSLSLALTRKKKKKNMNTVSSASTQASQQLLSQFLFLLDAQVLPTNVLLNKISCATTNRKFCTEKIQRFRAQHQDSNESELIREEFNGIVLELIDLIADGFSTSTSQPELQRHSLVDAVNDLQTLYSIFAQDEALVSGFWQATEKSRWRGATLTCSNVLSSGGGSNVANVIGSKLMLGVTFAIEL